MLNAALMDYTIDQRGDVGSNLRLEAIKAVNIMITLNKGNGVLIAKMRRPMQEIAKQAAEKLDKVRFEAWLCLQEYWLTQPDFPALARRYSQLADVSSTAYYRQLLELLKVGWIRAHIIQGLVSAAAAGPELLGLASRTAIVSYIQDQPEKLSYHVYAEILAVLTEHLRMSAAEDRLTVPTMELLAFMIDQDLLRAGARPVYVQHYYTELMHVIQIVHQPSSSLQRVEAALQVYSALYTIPETRSKALDKLTRLLLHRYPKVIY